MRYRFLAWDEEQAEFIYCRTCSAVREKRIECQDAGVFTGHTEIYCLVHGWTATTWEACSKCREERL
jgi:hypothetical protein